MSENYTSDKELLERYMIAKRALDEIADFDLYAEFGYIDEYVQAKAYEECRKIAMDTIKELNSKVNNNNQR